MDRFGPPSFPFLLSSCSFIGPGSTQSLRSGSASSHLSSHSLPRRLSPALPVLFLTQVRVRSILEWTARGRMMLEASLSCPRASDRSLFSLPTLFFRRTSLQSLLKIRIFWCGGVFFHVLFPSFFSCSGLPLLRPSPFFRP